MSPDPVLPQALLTCIHLRIWFTTAVSLVTVETGGWARNHAVGRIWGCEGRHQGLPTPTCRHTDACEIQVITPSLALLTHTMATAAENRDENR